MFPYIKIGEQNVPVFSVCVAVGMCVFVLSILIKAHIVDPSDRENFFILPKIFIALGAGYGGAVFFEAFFEIPVNGEFEYSGIMFYGGALTGMAAAYCLIKIRARRSRLSPVAWLDMMTVPFAVFHCIGRVGCFLAGCCYGRVTDGIFGVAFPDVPEAEIFHGGQSVYPTQLFEAVGLAALAAVLHFKRNGKFETYMIAYAVLRFALEFLRGDNRGGDIFGLSPSQATAFFAVYAAFAARVLRVRDALRRSMIAPNIGFRKISLV